MKTGYFDKALPLDRRAYVSKAKIQLALIGMEKYFSVYGEGLRMPETEAMLRGRRLHQAVLEPELFRRNRFISKFENMNTEPAKAWAKQKLREYPDAKIMSLSEDLELNRLIDRIMSHPMAGPLIAKAMKEKHGYAVCPRTGLTLYSRPDIITDQGEIAELKFVKSVDQFQFTRQQYSEKWFMQLAFYNLVNGLIRGERLLSNCFYVAVDPVYPHPIRVFGLNPVFEKMGDVLVEEGIDLIRDCLEKDPQMKNFEHWRTASYYARELQPEYFMLNNDERFKKFIQLA
jgi:hypothetical protein